MERRDDGDLVLRPVKSRGMLLLIPTCLLFLVFLDEMRSSLSLSAVLVATFFGLLAVGLAALFFSGDVLISLTKAGITIRGLFRSRTVAWEKVRGVQPYSVGRSLVNKMVRIDLADDDHVDIYSPWLFGISAKEMARLLESCAVGRGVPEKGGRR